MTKGPLKYDQEKQELVSLSSRLAYPVRDGIPVMLEDEARTISDPAGNAKLAKGPQGGRRLRARDDAAAAAVLAVSAGVRQPARPKPRWRYRGAA